MNKHQRIATLRAMSDEQLDEATLAAVRVRHPDWLPPDDAFAPTEYWQDAGVLIELFDIDVGPHNGEYMAYAHCRQDVAMTDVTRLRAICGAVILFTECRPVPTSGDSHE